ncbi:hypothetical protein FA13DRAFT_1784604 [Coprinellus micaceus]|uniref:Uncharacterized protein n=1 Tax=Coprinellus micaceus TaxID=71717 RepID=A0A4Y7U1M7_COPMI|nr:hypothetical protein FA13DRAFT_1784604 [Coprinellus micaceus]
MPEGFEGHGKLGKERTTSMAGEIHLPPLDYPQETLISESAQISSEGDQVGPKAGYGPQEDLAEFQRVAGILCVYLLALRSWQRAYSLWQATPAGKTSLKSPSTQRMFKLR